MLSDREKLMIYTILTGLIILFSKIRDRSFISYMRFDRTLPHPPDQPNDVLWITCCDCGLSHFILNGISATPARPEKYRYRFRFGAKAFTDPNNDLGLKAYKIARTLGWCGRMVTPDQGGQRWSLKGGIVKAYMSLAKKNPNASTWPGRHRPESKSAVLE